MCSSERRKCNSCNAVQRRNNGGNKGGKSRTMTKGNSLVGFKLDLNENTIRSSSSSSSSGSSESSPRKRSNKNNQYKEKSHSSFGQGSTSSSCPLHHISSSSRASQGEYSTSSIPLLYILQLVTWFITCKLYLIKKCSKVTQEELLTHVVVFFVSIICFVNSLNGDFVHDDIPTICTNQDVLGGTSLLQVFQNDFWGKPMSDPDSHKSYRPFTILTFRLNAFLAEKRVSLEEKSYSITTPTAFVGLNRLDPWGFHLVNVLIHALVVQMIILLARYELNCGNHLTLMTSLFFATHPIHTEAVSSIVGRADLLSAFFSLISFLSHARVIQEESNWPRWLGISTLAAFLAMLSKETGIMILPISIVYFFMRKKNGHVARRADCYFWVLKYKAFLIPVIAMTAFLWFRIKMLNGVLPYFLEQDNPAAFSDSLLTRLLTYSYLMVFNVLLMIYPNNLSYDWQMGSIPLITSFLDTRNLVTIFATLSFITLFAVSIGTTKIPLFLLKQLVPASRRKKQKQEGSFGSGDRYPPSPLDNNNQETEQKEEEEKYYEDDDEVHFQRTHLFLGLCFLGIPFLPASNLLVTVGFVVAERVLYLPSLGLTLMVICGWRKLLRFSSSPPDQRSWLRERSRKKLNTLIKLLFYGLVLSFMLKTIHRNGAWSSRKSLFESGLKSTPNNAKVHYNYANFLKDTGNVELAVKHYENAIRLWPKHESAYNNLGTMCTDPSEAEAHFKRALEINPFHPRSLFNLANIYNKRGLTDKAVRLLKRSIELDNSFAEPYSVLASVYAEKGMAQRAKILHLKALDLSPYNPDLINNYGAFLQSSGNTVEAMKQYLKALKIHPKHSTAHNNVIQIMNQVPGK